MYLVIKDDHDEVTVEYEDFDDDGQTFPSEYKFEYIRYRNQQINLIQTGQTNCPTYLSCVSGYNEKVGSRAFPHHRQSFFRFEN